MISKPPSHALANTRAAILDLAERLLQEKGYNAFSYKDISSPLGIKNAAVHYHFPTKAVLGVATLRRYRERFQEYIQGFEQSDADPLMKLNGYIAIQIDHLRNGYRICPLGILEAEYNTIPSELRAEAQALEKEIWFWVRGTLAAGREQNIFHFMGTSEDKACLISAALQGALQMARTAGQSAFFAIVRQLKRDLGLKE